MEMEDPEIEFLKSREEVTTGFEWEMFKENVRPLKRGRNVDMLNTALRSHSQANQLNSLLQTRKRFIEAIEEYEGDDPLQPWLECIKWVQEAFPSGGDCSGLIVIYEQCLRTFWHEDRYKNDLRYLKVWLEYAENCVDAEVIYAFLDVNKIGQTYSAYYIARALHMESKLKTKMVDDLFNRGLAMNAQPREILEVAYRKFLARSMRELRGVADENPIDNCHPVRSFGTYISSSRNNGGQTSVSDASRKNFTGEGGPHVSLSIYKDQKNEPSSSNKLDFSEVEPSKWLCLASNLERNKENNAVRTKWNSFKIPQRLGSRTEVPPTPSIEIFVDDDCSEVQRNSAGLQNSSTLQLVEEDIRDLERESELLRENPLRKFPSSGLPR